jgi:hypothetical protein
MCVLISVNFYFKSHPRPIFGTVKMALFAISFSLLKAKTLSASQMWRSDLDLWQYSYANEGSPFTSILLGEYLLKHDEKLAIDFMVWGVKNYDIVLHKPISLVFLLTIYKSALPVQKKIQIYVEC